MSFSTQDRPTNPAKFRIEVRSGVVRYYDKEEAKNIEIPVPFEFIVLDQLGVIRGWSDADDSGFWSNEVKSSGKEAFTVRTSKGVKATGLWKDIKSQPAVAGAKFNSSVYVAHKSGDGLAISNIALSGAALNAWIEFIQANKGVMKGKNKVVLSGFSDAKKGSVKYQVPVFESLPITDEEVDICNHLDTELQAYFGDYFNYKPADADEVNSAPKVDADEEPIDLSEIPF